MAGMWNVGGLDAAQWPLLTVEQRAELREWLASLGEDQTRISRVQVTEVQAEDGATRLMVSLHRLPDPLQVCPCGDIHLDCIRIQVPAGSWPAWLAGYRVDGGIPARTGG